MSNANIVGAAFQGVGSLIGLQMCTRLFTFFLNLKVATWVSPEIYGIASLRLQLVMTTILFLSREGVRRACQRSSLKPGENDQKQVVSVVSVAWLSVPVGVLIACIIVYGSKYLQIAASAATEGVSANDYLNAVAIFAVASVVELCSEPGYVLVQSWLLFRVRVFVEASAVLVRCLVTYLLVKANFGLYGFAYAQLIYGILLCVGYNGFCILSPQSPIVGKASYLLPRLRQSRTLLLDAGRFMIQSLEKYALTEGEKYIIIMVVSLTDSGVFALVSNLASLVARMLFQPIEETAFNVFSKLSQANEPTPLTPEPAITIQTRKAKRRVVGLEEKHFENVKLLSDMLTTSVNLVALLGLFAFTFGPGLSDIAIHLLYSGKWDHTNADRVLSLYCIYLLTMALNGVTEAFVHATASAQAMKRLSTILVLFSAVFVGVAVVLAGRWGSEGMIVANCINMLLRVAYSLNYIREYFQTRKVADVLKRCLPKISTLGLMAVMFVSTLILRMKWFTTFSGRHMLLQIGVSGLLLLTLLAITLKVTERDFLQRARTLWAMKRQQV